MNKRYPKVIVFLAIFLIGVGVGAGGFWLVVQNHMELQHYLLGQPAMKPVQAPITHFVQAIARHESATAMTLWEIAEGNTQEALTQRRESVIADLGNAGIQPDYDILSVEWWSTCCDPSVICDSRGAGGARLRVQLLDKAGQPRSYVFDVFTREQPYWGAAAGYPPREWVLRDVYPYDEKPLFWTR
jgi:hypothetical protein